MCVVGGAVDW